MFRSLRWRLTFWFVFLTTIVYTVLAASGIWLSHVEMMRIIDEELHALVDELRPAIETKHNKPNLQRWASTVAFRFLPTIQLYNSDQHLIEQHGPPGEPTLFLKLKEVNSERYHIRVYAVPLTDGRHIVGYIQLQLSLRNIDRSEYQFAVTMGLLAPFLLMGLGLAGYLFAGKATQPIEESFAVLKRFMSDAGHELGTPISIIQANAEAMEVELSPNSSTQDRLSVICRSNERMANLVKDLILLSKMESPQLTVKKTNVDLAKIVHTVLEEFAELFKAESITLLSGQIQSTQVFGDSESLKRLLTNLLQNALRYTESGGQVTISLEHLGRNAKLTVSDSGIGIPRESLPRIFERFYRVDKSRSRAAGGAGLGLSIAKAIVDSHKGKIEVHSKVGQGTTFTVFLPIRSEAFFK